VSCALRSIPLLRGVGCSAAKFDNKPIYLALILLLGEGVRSDSEFSVLKQQESFESVVKAEFSSEILSSSVLIVFSTVILVPLFVTYYSFVSFFLYLPQSCLGGTPLCSSSLAVYLALWKALSSKKSLKLPYLASYSLTLSAIEPSLNRDKSCTVRVSASYNEILSLLRPIFAISSSISTLSYISLMS
jgi:hypothetical protein